MLAGLLNRPSLSLSLFVSIGRSFATNRVWLLCATRQKDAWNLAKSGSGVSFPKEGALVECRMFAPLYSPDLINRSSVPLCPCDDGDMTGSYHNQACREWVFAEFTSLGVGLVAGSSSGRMISDNGQVRFYGCRARATTRCRANGLQSDCFQPICPGSAGGVSVGDAALGPRAHRASVQMAAMGILASPSRPRWL